MTKNVNFALASLLLALSFIIGAPAARAADDDPARVHVERAKAAFGLGRYDEAATAYEAAFQAKPTPALLYNAAQTHRMAGHKERALELYQSYLRLYRNGPNREESEQHAANLTRALEEEKRAATSPPNAIAEPEPAQTATVPAAAPPPSAPPATPAPESSVEVRAAAPKHDESLTSKPWFWVAVGGVVVAAAVTVFLLTRDDQSAPSPSAGTVTF